jgi:hypothetical protein
MKIKDLDALGLRKKTLDELETSLSDAISHDEFNKPDEKGSSYRERAIKRLINLKLSFSVNENLIFDFAKEFIFIKCPHCRGEMKVVQGGGSAGQSTTEFMCQNENCKTEVYLTIPSDGVYVKPKNEEY